MRVLVESSLPSGCWLHLTLFDTDTTDLSSPPIATHFQPVLSNRFSFACLTVPRDTLKPWSPETPHLYTLAMELVVGEAAAVPAQCEVGD